MSRDEIHSIAREYYMMRLANSKYTANEEELEYLADFSYKIALFLAEAAKKNGL